MFAHDKLVPPIGMRTSRGGVYKDHGCVRTAYQMEAKHQISGALCERKSSFFQIPSFKITWMIVTLLSVRAYKTCPLATSPHTLLNF